MAVSVDTSGQTGVRPVGVGILGCGDRVRSIVGQVLKSAENARVVALCDPDPASVAASQAAFGPKARVYGSAAEVVADPSVDWVFVGSWNCFHAEHAIAALHAGKHVFAEKPLATTLEDCVAIRDAVEQSTGTFSFGLVLRYAALYRRIHELLRSGAIGRVVSMEFNETLGFNHGGYIMGCWRRRREWAGTHLLEKCCHDIDLANWMVDSLPVRAASFGGLAFFRPENQGQRDRVGPGPQGEPPFTWPRTRDADPFTSDKDIVDHQVAILEYANGAKATFHTSLCSGIPERRMYLIGTEGALRADLVQGRVEVQRVGWDTSREESIHPSRNDHGGGDAILAQSVAETMTQGTPPLIGIQEALRSAVTCFGIDQALDEGAVIDLRPMWRRVGVQ